MLAISIGDVAGKGLAAALLMTHVQGSIRTLAKEYVSVEEVVTRMNRTVCSSGDHGKFVTFFYGVLDVTTKRLRYCNAGHYPPIVVRSAGTVDRLSIGGFPLGWFEKASYEQGTVDLMGGDRVVLFTDGIIDAENRQGLEFGDTRLVESVVTGRDERPERQLNTIMKTVRAFARRALTDDASMMVIAIND